MLGSVEESVLFLGVVWTTGPEGNGRDMGFGASETGLDARGKTLELLLLCVVGLMREEGAFPESDGSRGAPGLGLER